MPIGTEHTEKLTNVIIDAVNQALEIKDKGEKFTAMSLLAFLDEAAAIAAASGSWKELAPEWKDMTQEELARIVKNVETRLKISNVHAKNIVTKAFTFAANGGELYFAIKAARDAKKGV